MPSDQTAMPVDTPLVPPSQGHPSQQPHQAPTVPPLAPAYPYAAPAWPQPPAAYSGWAQPQPAATLDPDAALRKARTALGWAIGAAVGAFLALALAVVSMFMSGAGLIGDEGMFYESLRGQVAGVTDGASLSGSDLERSMTTVLEDWYTDVEDLSCPDAQAVTTSTSVVCTAELDGFEWTGVVFFENADGAYVILEL